MSDAVPKPRVHDYEVLPPSVKKHLSHSKRITRTGKLEPNHFYGEYHGHPVDMLEVLYESLRQQARESGTKRRLVWFVGDSSLDNKYWLRDGVCKSGVNGYDKVMSKKVCMAPDVAYWFNKAASEDESSAMKPGLSTWCAVNTAVEESTLGDRWDSGALLPHDGFCRDHVEAQDVLVLSAGGNDIALRPSLCSGLSMALLMFSPMWLVQSGWAPGTSHFLNLFREGVERYLRNLTAGLGQRKPSKVIVCTIYYPGEVAGGSWADGVLSFLGYNTNPAKLQSLIRRVFREATSNVSCDDLEVVAFPLFAVLDGKEMEDYAHRVEPSAVGGEKMGRSLFAAVSKGVVPAVPAASIAP